MTRPPALSTLFPYTTLFRSAARPDLPGATARLFEAKRRPVELALPVLAADQDRAWAVARPDAAARRLAGAFWPRSEEHTSALQSHSDLVCRLLLEKKKRAK